MLLVKEKKRKHIFLYKNLSDSYKSGFALNDMSTYQRK